MRLDCEDPDVEAALRAWLDASALPLPDPMCMRVRIAEPIAAPDERPPFEQPTVRIHAGRLSGAPADTVITWEVAPARALLALVEPAADVTLSPAAVSRLELCRRTFLTTTLIFLLRRIGWQHLHAALLRDPLGRGWLLAGDASTGKSTTAALLGLHGWQVGTDDVTFLVNTGERVEAHAMRVPIALRAEGHAMLERVGGRVDERRGKHLLRAEELGAEWLESAAPELLGFTRIGGSSTRVRELSARETLAELVRWSAWVVLEPELAQAHLDLLAALAAQCRCFRLELAPDLIDRPGLLLELLA